MAFEVKCMIRAIPKQEMRDLMFTLLIELLDKRVHTLLNHNPQIMRGPERLHVQDPGQQFWVRLLYHIPYRDVMFTLVSTLVSLRYYYSQTSPSGCSISVNYAVSDRLAATPVQIASVLSRSHFEQSRNYNYKRFPQLPRATA